MNLKGLNVVVTGASSGLGLAIARAFAAERCKLAITSNQPEQLESTAGELRGKATELLVLPGDLRDGNFIGHFAQMVLDALEWVDVLVNVAGIIIPEKIGSSDIANWRAVLDVNLTAPFMLVNCFAPSMNERSPSPLVVNVASLSGIVGSPYCASYVASKFGLVGLTEAINEEFRIYGRLRAVAICPGPINTPAWGPLMAWRGIAPSPEDKLLDPRDVADMIVRLVEMSDRVDVSRFVLTARKDIGLG